MGTLAITDVQDALIGLLEEPAAYVEEVTGRSVHVVTASLYVVGLVFPFQSFARYGVTIPGALFLAPYLIIFAARLRDALRLAARGPGGDFGSAMNPDRASFASIVLRLFWTVLTGVALARIGIAATIGASVLPQMSGFLFVLAVLVALHLHACTPRGGRRRVVGAAA